MQTKRILVHKFLSTIELNFRISYFSEYTPTVSNLHYPHLHPFKTLTLILRSNHQPAISSPSPPLSSIDTAGASYKEGREKEGEI